MKKNKGNSHGIHVIEKPNKLNHDRDLISNVMNKMLYAILTERRYEYRGESARKMLIKEYGRPIGSVSYFSTKSGIFLKRY